MTIHSKEDLPVRMAQLWNALSLHHDNVNKVVQDAYALGYSDGLERAAADARAAAEAKAAAEIKVEVGLDGDVGAVELALGELGDPAGRRPWMI